MKSLNAQTLATRPSTKNSIRSSKSKFKKGLVGSFQNEKHRLPSSEEIKYLNNQLKCENKSFTCKRCSKSFRAKFKAFRHIRVMHGLPKKINFASYLAESERKYIIDNTLFKSQRYHCRLCPASYKQKQKLRKHIKKKHGIPEVGSTHEQLGVTPERDRIYSSDEDGPGSYSASLSSRAKQAELHQDVWLSKQPVR